MSAPEHRPPIIEKLPAWAKTFARAFVDTLNIDAEWRTQELEMQSRFDEALEEFVEKHAEYFWHSPEPIMTARFTVMINWYTRKAKVYIETRNGDEFTELIAHMHNFTKDDHWYLNPTYGDQSSIIGRKEREREASSWSWYRKNPDGSTYREVRYDFKTREEVVKVESVSPITKH